ncbi:hypothetical protein [Streptacidiphilus carbonis]|uniref:hypothetical protein n=1 Tax=Streptacidiphilus carbonis TaxID=105422 RepID=UPI000AC7183C|nr:hypothetical protein [Streptacidiphilus carbonis]
MPASVYRIAEPGLLEPGEACRVTIDGDNIVTWCAPGEITQALIDDLDEAKRYHMQSGQWQLQPDASTEAVAPERNEGRGVARARYELVDADLLPDGKLCFAVETAGDLVWRVHRDHMTERFRDQINAYLRRIVGDGLLRQAWVSDTAG